MGGIVAVDLAAKLSAVCHVTPAGTVLSQADSWGRSEDDFIDHLVAPFTRGNPPTVMVVEDLPHRLPFAALVKAVCRLQGRIVDRMACLGAAGAVLFLPPALWRKHFDGLGRGTGPDAVVPVAAALGYTPPELAWRLERIAAGQGRDTPLAKDRATAAKVATDYCAAWLIARWAVDTLRTAGTLDVPGTSRYPTATAANAAAES